MKKVLFLACVAFALTSCVTTVKTAKIAETKGQLLNATVADLDVSPTRVSYTMSPSKEIRRAGISNQCETGSYPGSSYSKRQRRCNGRA